MPYHQQAGQMHQCSEDPADGVAEVKHRGGVEQPEDGGDPDEAEQAAANEADHHRQDGVAPAAQAAGQNIHAAAEQIGGADDVHTGQTGGHHDLIGGVEVTAGNVHDSVAWDAVYDKVTDRFPEVKFVTMDAGYKTPWIAKKVIEDSRIPILPYTRYKGKKDTFKPWDFTYNVVNDSFVCPGGHELRHTTTSKDGKRTYRSATQVCKDCPCRSVCGANENGQRMLTTHIWQEFLDLVEQLRKTERGKEIYAMRKQTIERVFADAKEKHAMRYTHHRGLARVSAWVRLKYAAMNLKKLALWKWSRSDFFVFLPYFFFDTTKTPALA